MKTVRLGTIGSGVIVHSILDNVARTEGITLEAVYSRTRETGEALAAQYGCAKVYTDLDVFLKDPDIDLVYIATPNLLHYPQAKQALLAGKHVLLEKPFTTRADHAAELIRIAKERGLFLLEAIPTAFLPNLGVLKEQLPKIGPVRLVMGNYSQYSSRYDRVLAGEKPNIFNPEYGGGCLMDLNYYNIYLNVALFGKPEDAVYYPNIHPGLADTSGVAVLRYDGFVSQNAGAKDTWGVNFFQIEGEKGYLYVENGPNGLASVRVVTRQEDRILNLQTNPDRWAYEVEAVTQLLLTENYEAAYACLDTTLAAVETLESCRRGAGIRFPGD